MKILHVVQHYLPFLGGVAISLHEICRRLSKHGYDIEVLCEQEETSPQREILDGVKVQRVQSCEPIRVKHGLGRIAPGMMWYIRKSDAHIVHGHSYGFFQTWAALSSKKPTILTLHSNPTAKRYPFWDLFREIPTKLCDHIVALTEMEKAQLVKRGTKPGKVSVISNGINLPAAAGRDLGIHPMILCLGRLEIDDKGQDILLAAMKKLQRLFPKAQLVIAGDGKDALRTKQMAMRFGVSRTVLFVGDVRGSSKWDYIKSCDVLCIPSRTESFPLVCLEGMAFGKPIVATNVGGISEVVQDAGVVVRPNSPDALADALIEVLGDEQWARKLGNKGLQRVEAFNWNSIVPKYIALYESLVKA